MAYSLVEGFSGRNYKCSTSLLQQVMQQWIDFTSEKPFWKEKSETEHCQRTARWLFKKMYMVGLSKMLQDKTLSEML